MKKSLLFGLATTLFRAKKYKFALAGIHFAVLGYQLIKQRIHSRMEDDEDAAESTNGKSAGN
jgi:hypothetical protein